MATRARAREAPRAARPGLRVIRGQGDARGSLVPLVLIIVLTLFAVAALQAYLGEQGFRIGRLERASKAADERHQLLRSEVAELSSPERLDAASEHLGLEPAERPIFLQAPRPDLVTAGADRR